jgi:hypothetical protein
MYTLKKIYSWLETLVKWGLLAAVVWLLYSAYLTFEPGAGRDRGPVIEQTPLFEK